jgi:hypothetical protein
VSVTKPSDAVTAGMDQQTEERLLALSRKSPPSFSSLVGWLIGSVIIPAYTAYEDETECS